MLAVLYVGRSLACPDFAWWVQFDNPQVLGLGVLFWTTPGMSEASTQEALQLICDERHGSCAMMRRPAGRLPAQKTFRNLTDPYRHQKVVASDEMKKAVS